MNRKRLALAAAAILALGVLAMWLVARDPHRPGDAAQPVPPIQIAQERPPPPVDQAQLDRIARAAVAHDQLESLRVAYEGGRPDPRSTARLEAALRQLWPGPTPRWSAPCRNRICRVTVEQPPTGWADALLRAPSVTAIADRVVADAEGPEALAFVLLAAEDAPSGSPTLELVERTLVGSPRVSDCLRGATEKGTVEYELFIDVTGITYVRSGTADVATQSCVEAQLADIITSTGRPPKVKSESRRITLRTP